MLNDLYKKIYMLFTDNEHREHESLVIQVGTSMYVPSSPRTVASTVATSNKMHGLFIRKIIYFYMQEGCSVYRSTETVGPTARVR